MPDGSARGKTKSQRPEAKLGETQKADRFWFAPGAAKKAGQWRLRTRRCCNHAGLFLDRLKHRSRAPSTENAKSGQVLVRTREDKTESIDYFKGGMSGVLKLLQRV
jgi:hypothetical protein